MSPFSQSYLRTSSYKPVAQVSNTRTDGRAHAQARNASWRTRLLPFCIVIPTFVSLCVVSLHARRYTDTGKLYQWSTSNRALVQVVVHIVSSLLALLWTYSICTLMSQWTRHRMSHESVNVNTLRLWSALMQNRADWSLPRISVSATLAFLILGYVPATLWAGALTPAVTLKLVSGLSISGSSYLPSPAGHCRRSMSF
jgi:hypothetical protein